MSFQRRFTLGLADALLSGPWTVDSLLGRLNAAVGESPTWGKLIAKKVFSHFHPLHPDIKRDDLARFIANDSDFQIVWCDHKDTLRIRNYVLDPLPGPPPRLRCDIPEFGALKILAGWFGVSLKQLDGYADIGGFAGKAAPGPRSHYHYLWKEKTNGARRLIEIPKPRIRTIQEQIYRGILNRIPLHEACHGFRRGRSCLTYAAPHSGKRIVMRMDLSNFFLSIPARRIHGVFNTVGYSHSIARYLAGLCTNRGPNAIVDLNEQLAWHERKLYDSPHLPQGAPCSPMLANLCAFRLDLRLSSLADALDAVYTRYADDLAFSGGAQLETAAERIHVKVGQIAIEEGFLLNTRKTRVMRRGVSQRLTGIVLNQHANYPRKDYDRLKAMLYNCIQYGPDSQNRTQHSSFRAHLQGRIAHVRHINPQRAERLDGLFRQIRWN